MSTHRVSSLLLDMEKVIAYGWGHTLVGFNVKYKEVTVMLVLKARDRRGRNVVAFIETYSLLDCLEYLDEATRSKAAPLTWRPDKWAPKNTR